MAVWSVVKSSNIEYTRIDGEYYQPKYINELNIWENLSKTTQIVRLKAVIDKPVRTGSTPSNRLFQINDEKVPFIKTNTLREGKIVFSEIEFLPKRVIRKSDYIEDLATIVTIIGATKEIVGRVAIKRESDPISTTNQNVGIINFNTLVNPYFGMIYLQSKYGRDQLWRHSRQTEQVNLNCREIERILFPLFDSSVQDEIGGMVKKSFDLQDEAISLYKEAEELLEKELGLDSLEFEKPRSYTAKLSEVYSHNRCDADFYQTKFRQIAEHINTLETLPLRKIAMIQKGFEVGTNAYVDSGKLFIRVSNFTKNGFSQGGSDKYISDTTYAKHITNKPNIGDILLTKDGTVGVCYVVDSDIEGIISSGIVKLLPLNETIPKEYLSLAINSKLCQMQIQRDCSGALIVHWKPEDIRNLKIPILSDETMNSLANMATQSKQALKQSKQLLEDAKVKVEALIEEAIR